MRLYNNVPDCLADYLDHFTANPNPSPETFVIKSNSLVQKNTSLYVLAVLGITYPALVDFIKVLITSLGKESIQNLVIIIHSRSFNDYFTSNPMLWGNLMASSVDAFEEARSALGLPNIHAVCLPAITNHAITAFGKFSTKAYQVFGPDVKMFHIPNECFKKAASRQAKTVAVLGTKFSTSNQGEFRFFDPKLYEKEVENVRVIFPSETDRLLLHTLIVEKLLASPDKEMAKIENAEIVNRIITNMMTQDNGSVVFDAVFLACTELPLLYRTTGLFNESFHYDTIGILVEAISNDLNK
jgi:aspartate/glutamate racemase